MTAFRNVLIVRMSAIGDVVDCLPALAALRKALPGAKISWIVDDRCADLLRGHPCLDELISVPRRKWVNGLRNPALLMRTAAEILEFYASQRRRTFDAVFDFQSNLKSGFNGFMTGAPFRIGLDAGESRECNVLFNNSRSSPCPPGMHRVDRNLNLLRCAGIPAGAAEFILPSDAEAAEKVRGFADRVRAEEGALLLFNPHASAKGGYKRWPSSSWTSLARTVRAESRARPVILWGPGEKEAADGLCRNGDALPAPATSLPELIELIRRADLLVGADSGPMHIAWALGTPVVAIFGPKDPRVYGPYGGRGEVLYLGLDCSPCREIGCPDVKCMGGIPPDAVAAAVRSVLSRTSRRGLPAGAPETS